MYDAVELADIMVDKDLCVTCVPVINSDLEEDVAVVGLEPNSIAHRELTHSNERRRVRALLAVAIHSHRLLPASGLTFRCPSSS
jgi:hypothetical protein